MLLVGKWMQLETVTLNEFSWPGVCVGGAPCFLSFVWFLDFI